MALSVGKKIAYAVGNGGAVLGLQMIGTWVLPLYTPPEGKGFHNLVPGLLVAFAINLPRVVDTFFDPWLANRSDRSASPLGRRRKFMLISFVPLGLATGLVFWPPIADESVLNAVYLTLFLGLYFCLFSTYVAPYLALLPELFPDKVQNTQVSTMQAAAALIGGMVATVIAPALLPHDDFDRHGLRVMCAALALLSLVLLAVPVLFIDERKYIARAPGTAASHLGPFASIASTFKERSFIPYVIGSTLFWVGFTSIQTAAPNYVEVLLGKTLDDIGLVLGPLFGVAAVFFVAIGPLQKKLGKRGLMMFASVMLAVLMGAGIPLLQAHPQISLPLFSLCGIPIAIFLAVPNAILADICDANAIATGERREAMFFGAQGFLQKVSVAATAAIVSVLAETLGKSAENALGVQMSGPLAAVALVGAAISFSRYPEADVQRRAESKGG